MAADPFSLVYDKIVSILRAKGLTVVSHNSVRGPSIDTPSSADMPEIQVHPVAHTAVLGGASCETDVVRDFALVIQTEDLVLGKYLFPWEWKLIQALYQMRLGSELNNLEFLGRKFVRDVTVVSATTGITDPLVGRRIEGWASNWTIRVAMSFSPANLS